MDGPEDPAAGGRRQRLHVFLAHSGVASRRAAERLIAEGRVSVNGRVIDTPGASVDPCRDEVEVDGLRVGGVERLVYYAVYKPAGMVSTASDPEGRPKVTDLVHTRERLYPVGRLDVDSEGLLILTNDGDLALRLTHPRYRLEREYQALVEGIPGPAALDALAEGIELDDGWTLPARVELLEGQYGRAWLRLVLREGRKRQVRRMLAAVGHPVLRLVRVRIGLLRLEGMRPGEVRWLGPRDLSRLRATRPWNRSSSR